MSTVANKNIIAKVKQNNITQKQIKPPVKNLINFIISCFSIHLIYNYLFN